MVAARHSGVRRDYLEVVVVTVELTKAEIALVDLSLASQEYFDRNIPATATKQQIEETAQRRTLILPLRLKFFQALNRAGEQSS